MTKLKKECMPCVFAKSFIISKWVKMLRSIEIPLIVTILVCVVRLQAHKYEPTLASTKLPDIHHKSKSERDIRLCPENLDANLFDLNLLYFTKNCTYFLFSFSLGMFIFVLYRNYKMLVELENTNYSLVAQTENIRYTLDYFENFRIKKIIDPTKTRPSKWMALLGDYGQL